MTFIVGAALCGGSFIFGFMMAALMANSDKEDSDGE